MGQFDKQQAPSAGGQKNKIIMVVALAAALAGVMGFQFWKNSPQSAMASTGNEPGQVIAAAPGLQLTVSQEIAALENDPTASLLNGHDAQDTTFLVPPRDPFRMSKSWIESLKKPETVISPTTHVEPENKVLLPQAANTDGIKLQGIFLEHQKLAAFVNGNIVHAGMIVGNVRICDITNDRIIVQNPDFPNGPRTEILLKSPLNK